MLPMLPMRLSVVLLSATFFVRDRVPVPTAVANLSVPDATP